MVEKYGIFSRRQTIICILILVFQPFVKGKLRLFIEKDGLKSSLNLDLETSFFLIYDGQTASLLRNPQAFHDFIAPLAPTVDEIKLTWRSHPVEIKYNMKFWSSDNDVVPRPTVLNVPLNGKVPLYDKEFTIRFPCSGKKAGVVDIGMSLNYSALVGTSSSNFTIRVRRKCNAKDNPEQNNKGKTLHVYKVEKSPKQTLSRGVIVALAAGLTITVCIVACITIYIYYQKRNRKLQMKFDADYELAATQKLRQYRQQRDQKDLVEDLYADENDGPPRPIFKPKNKHCHKKWKKSSRHRRNLHISMNGTPPPAYTPKATSPVVSPGSLARILENIPEEQEELREDENMIEDEEKRPILQSHDNQMSNIPETNLVENASFMLQCEVKEEKPSTKRITICLGAREIKEHGQKRVNVQNSEDLYKILNEDWREKFKGCLLSSEQITFDSHPLGNGAFGRVYKGKARGISKENPDRTYVVAVKVLRDASDFDTVSSFVSEGLVMREFHHPNVLNLLGVVLQSNSPPMLLMPFMKYGDLNQFLRNARATPRRPQSLSTRQLIHFGIQISRGMEHLSSLQYVHRDLATRNCMVGEDLGIKVADFGLATNVIHEENSHNVRRVMLPMKWMPLESLTSYIFTEKSDVWSFGVVLWELMTLGKQPYLGLDNQQMEAHLQKGNRLIQPQSCPDEIYQIMCSCWKDEPLDRPTFSELTSALGTFESKYKKYTLDYTLPATQPPI